MSINQSFATPELQRNHAMARHRGWPMYENAELNRLLCAVERRFPGMQVLCLRPIKRCSDEVSTLVLRWDRAKLLHSGILQPEDVPVAPKRMAWKFLGPDHDLAFEVRCTSRARFTVRIDVADDLLESHPLAMFRPSSIRVAPLPGKRCGSWLRLVVDNTREKLDETQECVS